jgi:hypothetical protein
MEYAKDGGERFACGVAVIPATGLRAESGESIITPKGVDQGLCPTHLRGQVENATAPSAGGSPGGVDRKRGGKVKGRHEGPEGEVFLRGAVISATALVS